MRAAWREVQQHVSRYGEIEVCQFAKGWFADTMPEVREPVVAGFIDVDLASSTRTCLEHLYPRLVPGGVLFHMTGTCRSASTCFVMTRSGAP